MEPAFRDSLQSPHSGVDEQGVGRIGRVARRACALLGATALGGCQAAVDVCDAPGTGARPSLVVVVADTLRADALAHGGELTPALDVFAAESVAFRAAFAQAPWTKPSVASLMTGLHPGAHGVTNHDGRFWSRSAGGVAAVGVLPDALQTFAEVLRDAGYATAAFVANRWLGPGYGFDQGFEHYDADISPDRIGAVFARADLWLDGRDPERPFLLYLHLMEPHGPYDAPEALVETARKAAAGAGRPLSQAEFESIPEYLRAPAWAATAAARDLREWRARYAAGVAALDRGFGLFVKHLEQRGLLDSTSLIVTADHGEELMDHGGWDHGDRLFDEQLHVPLLMRLPGARRAGTRVESVVSLVDLYPTLLASAGAEGRGEVHGESLLPLACGLVPEDPERASFATATKWNPNLQSIRTRSRKLIVDTGSGAGVFFDLENDPRESRDVARERREEAQALARRLFAFVADAKRGAPAREEAPIDAVLVEQLEALGYGETP